MAVVPFLEEVRLAVEDVRFAVSSIAIDLNQVTLRPLMQIRRKNYPVSVLHVSFAPT